MNPKIALIIAVITVSLDYVFHLTFTQPMEVPLYFIAKFLVALTIAYFLVDRFGLLKSAIVFTLFFDGYYYVGVIVLRLYYLSSSPNQIIQILNITDPTTLAIAWTLAHGAFFYTAGVFGRLYGGNRR